MIGVREAARRLGVSPRRVLQRIDDGTLPATRVGTQWVVEPAQLPLAAPRPSRPLSPRIAWALLDHLAGPAPDAGPIPGLPPRPGPAPDLDATERRRVASYAVRLFAADDPAALLRGWMARRADRHELRAAPADLEDLRGDERLVLSGVSAPDSFVVSPTTEAYVAASDLDGVLDDYLLVDAAHGTGNVVLHVVARLPARIAWPVLAADLSEHLGSRESARAAELVREHGQVRGRPAR